MKGVSSPCVFLHYILCEIQSMVIKMEDCQGRKINYLRISVSDRCNLRCKYCMPKNGIKKKAHAEMLSLEEIYDIVVVCVNLGIDKIRITGGEPLVRRGITELIKKISKLNGIKDISMTTNGILLKDYARELKNAGLMRVNISLDTLNKLKFNNITRIGKLEDVLEGIEEAKKVGLKPIKLNTVLIGGFNEDEIEDFVEYTKNGIDVRFIELMPIGQASSWTKYRFITNQKVLEKVRELKPVESKDLSSPATYYKLPDAKGRVGLINPISHRFCANCNRIRLTADGKLKPCLHSNQEIDIKTILREKKDISDYIIKSIIEKPSQHEIGTNNYKPVKRDMFRIGG